MNRTPHDSFQSVADRVAGRIALARWLNLLAKTALPLFTGLAIATIVGWWFAAFQIPWVAGILMVLAWLVGTGLVAWISKPAPVAAISVWDSRTGRKDMFTSAFCFEAENRRTVGQELHLLKASRALGDELPKLSKDIPLPFSQRSWIFPFSFLAVVVAIAMFAADPIGAATVDDGDKERAKQVAEELKEAKEDLDKKEGLDEKEKKKLDEFKQELDKTQEKLKKLDEQTRKEVLAELEKRAKEAEALAAELAGKGEQLSSEMLKELAKHSDTAELAGALQAQNMKATEAEAGKMQQRLESNKLTLEEQKRIGKALDSAMKKANTKDRQSLLGKNLNNADKHLKNEQPKPAGKEFGKIAQRAKKAQQRQKAQQRLKQIAKQLRKSGQKIFGKQNNGLQKLSGAPKGTNLKSLANVPMGKLPLGKNAPASQNNAPLPNGPLQPPNPNAQVSTGNPPPNANQSPVPGQPKAGQCKGGQCPVPGSKAGNCKGGQCAGTKPGSKAGQCAGGNCPVPGSKPGAKKGGLKAGVGSANPFAGVTNPFKPSGTETVNAQINKDGQSQVKNIDPRPHQENTRLSNKEIEAAVDRAEEGALAEELLPQSRKGQVKRYFQALRASLKQ